MNPTMRELTSILRIIDEMRAENPARTGLGASGWDAACGAIKARLSREFELPIGQAPVVGNSDPESSREGARRIEPSRDSRCGEVLARLRQSPGVWVQASNLANETCGGSEGLRRLRELRDEYGYNIEGPSYDTYDRTNSFYRLIEGPPVDDDEHGEPPIFRDRVATEPQLWGHDQL